MDSKDRYCRLCLTEDKWDLAVSIFEGNPFKESLCETIGSLSGVAISANDGLPGVICLKCLGQLTLWIRFKDEITKNDKFLRHTFCKASKTKANTINVLQQSKVANPNNNVGSYKIFNPTVDKMKPRKKPGPKPKGPKLQIPVSIPLQTRESEIVESSINKSRHPLSFCELCNRPFNRSREKNSHVKMLHSNPAVEHYSCDYCSMSYMDKISVDCHKKLYHPYLTEEVFLQKKKMIEAALKETPSSEPCDSRDNVQSNCSERPFSNNDHDFDLIEEIKSDKCTPSSKRKRPNTGAGTNKVKRSKGLSSNKENGFKKVKITLIKSFTDGSSNRTEDSEMENTVHQTVVEVHATMNSNDSVENKDTNEEVSDRPASCTGKVDGINDIGDKQVEETGAVDEKTPKAEDEKIETDEVLEVEALEGVCTEIETNPADGSEKIESNTANSRRASVNGGETLEDPSSTKSCESNIEVESSELIEEDVPSGKDLTESIGSELSKLDGNKVSLDSESTDKPANETPDEKKSYRCNVCSLTFQAMKELFHHKRTHK